VNLLPAVYHVIV